MPKLGFFKPSPDLNSLPDICFEKILGYVRGYEEISKLRMVNRRFDHACQKILNSGFYAVQKYHAQCLKDIKTQLPRRESQRRSHHLAKHVDILNSVETRISLLTMTYSKYLDSDMCCFIPGKVLDELYSVICYIVSCKTSPKTSSELLQELRDISSMAMEHFEEKVVPLLKRSDNGPSPYAFQLLSTVGGTPRLSYPSKFTAASPLGEAAKVAQLTRTVANYKANLRTLKTQVDEHQKKIVEQDRLLSELNRKLAALITENPAENRKRKKGVHLDETPAKVHKNVVDKFEGEGTKVQGEENAKAGKSKIKRRIIVSSDKSSGATSSKSRLKVTTLPISTHDVSNPQTRITRARSKQTN